MRASTVQRIEVLSLENIEAACSALIAQLRRIHEGYRNVEGGRWTWSKLPARLDAAEAELKSLREKHVRSAEALLNFVSVLEAEKSGRAEEMRAGLERVLRSARELGMGA